MSNSDKTKIVIDNDTECFIFNSSIDYKDINEFMFEFVRGHKYDKNGNLVDVEGILTGIGEILK